MQVRFDSGSAFNCLEFDELVFGVSGRYGGSIATVQNV